MFDPQKYTVGWICAIDTEYVAAQAFLDEKHKGPEYVSVNDNNHYTLGRVGEHNVVMAVAPDGEYGAQSAAAVARDMMHSFPNVRIGLMVGIGGGVPSQKHDIRLGDVVVSAPRDGKGGVFQYDFGKAKQDQDFQTTGFLNQPPPLLRTAVAGLRSHYELDGHRLEEDINSILNNRPRLQKKYRRPDPSSDRLFLSEVIHPLNDERSCAEACDVASSNLVLRNPRTEAGDNPAIHYGLIASANQVMRDALIRDVAAKQEILCFETEAAGLMNHFPCLVTRGICNYSDSHKNKQWQGYAAMAAAAYARDLLAEIPPNKVEVEKPIVQTLSEVQKDVKEVLYIQHNQENGNILQWLTPIEYSSQQHDFISKRQPGTGQWLLNSEEFNAWLDATKHTLFCRGIPGAGKTFLTSIVIDNLCRTYGEDKTVGIAYIYCSFRQQGTQKVDDSLASLLKQLAQAHSSLLTVIKDLYDHHIARKMRPSKEDLMTALRSVIALSSKTFIILDALDELSNDCRTQLLSELFKIQAKTNLDLFVTSRPSLDVEKEFKECISCEPLEILAREEDGCRYLEGRISELHTIVSKRPDLWAEIRRTISEAVEGMFLLAQLYFGFLQDKTTTREIKDALKEIRGKTEGRSSEDSKLEALTEAYKQTMERINGQLPGLRVLANKVLSWITCARRPLSTSELQHGVAVIVGESELDQENLCGIDTIIAVCSGLVIVDKNSQIIRLVHYTTQEYFEKHRDLLPNAETYVAETCLTYLSFDAFESGFCPSDKVFEERLQHNPLFDYAAQNWAFHFKEASSKVQQMVLKFLGNEAKVNSSNQAMTVSGRYTYSNFSQNVPSQVTGVHLAARFGLVEIMTALLKKGFQPDYKNTFGQTPVSYASENGHEAVVQLLIENGAAVDSTDADGWTPLSYASRNGHEAVVQLLIENGAAVDSTDKIGQTPLSHASENGHEAVVQLLIENGAAVDSTDTFGRTPLSSASENGHEAVVQLLIENGAAVDSTDTEDG